MSVLSHSKSTIWFAFAFLLAINTCISLAESATYHVDSITGNDRNSGTSPADAWKTLDRVNFAVFVPGDKILFKAGTQYSGQLKPQGSGSKDAPIIIDMYGEGSKPRIDGNGRVLDTIYLYNVEYWEINNLEITNTGRAQNWTGNVSSRFNGVRVKIDNFGTAHHIHLKNLYIHDVNSSPVNVINNPGRIVNSGTGILFNNEGELVKSRFDDVLIENCHLVRINNGIVTSGMYFYKRSLWHPNLNVVIRGNLLEEVGTHGIVPCACDGVLVEYNTIRDAGSEHPGAVGIFPWSCDNSLIQFNEVSGTKNLANKKDGEAFDSDFNCQNTIFQYNYSRNNQGGFMLVCDAGDYPDSVRNSGTIVRYNISQNDGRIGCGTDTMPDGKGHLVRISGPCQDTQIYNNVFFVGRNLDIWAVVLSDWEGYPIDTYFYNNIFYVEGTVSYDWSKAENYVFKNNVYYGYHDNMPRDTRAITSDPMLVNPGTGGNGFETLGGYKLKDGSPCINAGTIVKNNVDRGFWRNILPMAHAPNIGAHQK